MQLPLLTDPAAEKRSGDLAKAQLLFFPTGGGKTEAYLGLAAYAFAIRRLQGVVGHAGRHARRRRRGGRADAVHAAAADRAAVPAGDRAGVRGGDGAADATRPTWGSEPFRIGLWVGTDVSPKRYRGGEGAAQAGRDVGRLLRLTVLQFQRCPWCGTPIGAANVRADDERQRVYVYCGDELGDCPFSRDGTVADGLPVLTVDEEIYRLAPAFVIATVDKFARLAREGEAASLFGYVAEKCELHGYVHPDYAVLHDPGGQQAPEDLPRYRRPGRRGSGRRT